MSNLKAIEKLLIVIFAFIIAIGCNEANVNESKEIPFKNGLELDLDLKLYQPGTVVSIDQSLENFFWNEIGFITKKQDFTLEGELMEITMFRSSKGNFFVMDRAGKTDAKTKNYLRFISDEKTCKTCEDEQSVRDTLSDAIGDGDEEVKITYRYKGDSKAEICYTK